MTSDPTIPGSTTLVLSYMTLRKIVGLIAIALPPVLVLGRCLLDGAGMERSISAYYYTSMRDVMVGSLCAIATFLLSYHGPERQDDVAGDVACAFALGVALFPTAPAGLPSGPQAVVSGLHSLCAGGFFLTLTYFSLVLFRKGSPRPTPRKRLRNHVYAVCGGIILLCAAGLGAVHLVPDTAPVMRWSPTFWLEATGIWAFGWSWFTKGEGILRDKEV